MAISSACIGDSTSDDDDDDEEEEEEEEEMQLFYLPICERVHIIPSSVRFISWWWWWWWWW